MITAGFILGFVFGELVGLVSAYIIVSKKHKPKRD